VAQHTAHAYGRSWSGTPDDFVHVAREVQAAARSASKGNNEAVIFVKFSNQREAKYDSPEEFLAGIRAADIPQVRSLNLVCIDHNQRPTGLVVVVYLVRGLREKPYVTAEGNDPALVDGAARRVAALFGGRGWWQGLRREELSRLQRVGARAGFWWVVAVTAILTGIVTAVVTVYLTRLLAGH
jgi:hypothetical protein